MNEKILLLLSFIAGMLLGVVFYGGLWFTVKRGIVHNNPAILFLLSLLLRTSVTLVGFYFVSGGDASRLILCLVGFILVRIIITRATRLPKELPYEN